MSILKVYTFADKRPDFISMQASCLRHFLRDHFEFVVFENANSIVNRIRIHWQCRLLGIKCIHVAEQDHSEPTIACARPLQWSYDFHWKNEEGIVAILDSDMFPIADFSIEEFLDGFDVAGTKQKRGHVIYLWNGIMFFNMRSLPDKDKINFMFGEIEGHATDVGGFLYYWIRDNSNLHIRHIPHTSHICSINQNFECLPIEIREKYDQDFCFEIYSRAFLHYGRGSNWDRQPKDYHNRKTELLKYWLNGAKKGTVVLPEFDYEFPL